MLLTRADMTYDFGGARFRVERDRELLSWIFSQFLYGEVTGIQVGHWIHVAPDLSAAQFLARQATEEFSHVNQFLRIFDLLGTRPVAAHPMVRFLATGFIGDDFEEHTALEMAQGEGFVLMVFYALCDTLDDPRMVAILEAATRQEERHVEFGERWTERAVRERPGIRRRLLGQVLVSLHALKLFAALLARRLDMGHEVLRHLPTFLDATNRVAERRLLMMGLLDRPLAELGVAAQALLVAQGLAARASAPLRRKRPLLTDTYLRDPLVTRRNGKDGAVTATAAVAAGADEGADVLPPARGTPAA
jgi:hypothetical protein